MKEKSNSVLTNLSWKFAERMTAQIVTMIVSVILARILDPNDYGTVAIVTVFISLANVFVSDGFGSALIQKKDADSLDFSSVLYFNICLSIFLYTVLFFVAPVISRFYGVGYEILTPVLRVLGIRLIFCAINTVQQAYVSKKMIFRKFFWATLLGTVVSAIVGITMAYNGYGVWALVAQYLTNTTVDTIVLNISLKLRPRLEFSFGRIKSLLNFGVKILGTKLLTTGYQELRALIIGKLYSSSDLAFYDKGRQFPDIIVTNINSSISAVLFPKMSSQQDDKDQLKNTTRQAIRFGSFFMFPMMLGLAAIARPLVMVVFTEKWANCIPLIQMCCIVYLFQPIHTANLQAIKAVGRSDIILKLELIKKAIEIIVLIAVMHIGVNAIVAGMAGCSVFFVFLNAYPNKQLINYSIAEQIADMRVSAILSIIMFIIVWAVSLLPFSTFFVLIVQVIIGIITYLLLCKRFSNNEYSFLFRQIKTKIQK